jgi:xanthine dehydrogenase accessory factor
VSDDDAFAVGLTCGGIIDVFVEAISRETFPELGAVIEDINAGRPVAVATSISDVDPDRVGRRLIVRPDAVTGSLGSARLDDAVRDDARGLLQQGSTAIVHYGPDGERRGDDISIFVASYAPRPRMIVFGAIDFAAAVARIGAFLGYRVTVCDARPTFATAKRFPDADEVIVEWPHRYLARTEVDERTVVCVLTHDPKFDVPLLEVALKMPLAYLGAMGSRRTNEDRAMRLKELGFTEDDLARLHAPIGLDVGGRTPEETAVSIAAEIIAARWGGSGAQLRHVSGPIHGEGLS